MSKEKAVSAEELVSNLEEDTLLDLYSMDHPERRGEVGEKTKKNLVRSIVDKIEETGYKFFVLNLSKEGMQELLEGLDINWGNDNKHSKAVLGKRLIEQFYKKGLEEFLAERADVEGLKGLCEMLELEPVSSKKEQLARQVADRVRQEGLETYLSSVHLDSLQDMCDDLKLKTRNTSSKRKLVDALLYKKDVEDEPKKKKQKTTGSFSKTKKKIEKGITFDDIFQHYYANELKDWCKEHDIPTTGKKTLLIKRILAYLEGGDTGSSSSSSSTSGKGKGKGKGAKKGGAAKKGAKSGGNDEKEQESKAKEEAGGESEQKGGKKTTTASSSKAKSNGTKGSK
ncbi:SAP domain-containing protein [Balamuthia mandrillaris]